MNDKHNFPDEKTDDSDKPLVEEKDKPDEPKEPLDESDASKLADVGPKTKFIGFFRLGEKGNWDLHPQILSSEDSIINKIHLTHGECDIHVMNVELPD